MGFSLGGYFELSVAPDRTEKINGWNDPGLFLITSTSLLFCICNMSIYFIQWDWRRLLNFPSIVGGNHERWEFKDYISTRRQRNRLKVNLAFISYPYLLPTSVHSSARLLSWSLTPWDTPRVKSGSLTHFPPSSEWGNWHQNWGDKCVEERTWSPYLTKLIAQDNCTLLQALPQH